MLSDAQITQARKKCYYYDIDECETMLHEYDFAREIECLCNADRDAEVKKAVPDVKHCGNCIFYAEHGVIRGLGNCTKLILPSELPFWATNQYDYYEVSHGSGVDCPAWRIVEPAQGKEVGK